MLSQLFLSDCTSLSITDWHLEEDAFILHVIVQFAEPKCPSCHATECVNHNKTL